MRPALRWDRVHLQFILDLPGLAAHKAAHIAAAAARGGVDSIQVRGKGLGAGDLLRATCLVMDALRDVGLPVPVLVNDRLDVALLAGADGVHLPESGWPPPWAQRCRQLAALAAEAFPGDGPEAASQAATDVAAPRPFAVGRAIHSTAAAALPGTEQLDYVMFGHVFATASKAGLPPRGVAALARAAAAAPVPVIAVGGITPANAAQAVEAGAAGVAVIRAIRDAPDPAAAAAALREAIDRAPRPAPPVGPAAGAKKGRTAGRKEDGRCG
ncbi:MAG TPA: thiamine phosphate synthase [Limnochordales bacterium]|nr:thiamine phosphate synthase [Limnochordales bacterium]